MNSMNFWKHVDVTGNRPSDCWNWIGTLTPDGYGRFAWRVGYKIERAPAHCVSYELEYGDIPEGEIVRHMCDNRKCVRPSHLTSGTKKDNAEDAVKRGRYSCGDDHWTRRR